MNEVSTIRPKKFEYLEHTGDIGLKIYGTTLPELFANAAEGFTSIITEVEKIEPKFRNQIVVEANGLEELMIRWLNQINYLFEVEGKLFTKWEVCSLNKNRLSALGEGEDFDAQKHPILHEVKAATYHQLKLEKRKDGWFAQVIFDL
ncbi:hypothetical protein DRQ00_03165 [candidate division KSB1 bacterium]|nr:MAG: hypothetical protein DRQ00_03165 [candidate division KSB1 bacterium]